MISSKEIRAKALKLWENNKLQLSHLEGQSIFPWTIPAVPPTTKELSGQFSQVRKWIQSLKAESKEAVGQGYLIHYRQKNHRKVGTQSIPGRISVETLEDFLFLTGKKRDFQRFIDLTSYILAELPTLKGFLIDRPSVVLEHSDDWKKLIAVCQFFSKNPKTNLYIRQLDIPGVDTKFIESNFSILASLLEILLPEDQKTPGVQGLADHGFERRFGLRYELPTIRFRLLDPAIALSGLTDLSLPLSEFQNLNIGPERVLIVENKMSGLAFPELEKAMVVFGLGYGVGVLKDVLWLKKLPIYYWGDIDTHGFAILDYLRADFPSTNSILMDEETLLSFKELWGKEEEPQRFLKDLSRLTPSELEVFNGLRADKWGSRVRLEQERIGFGYLQRKIAEINR